MRETLCSPAVFKLWKANGVLGALLWYPEIRNMDEYLVDLSVAIDNVLDRWAVVEPTRITVKYKLHVLSHIPDAVCVLSNHQAPSLDIAMTLADMERFKHQVSGGWWMPDDEDEWTQAGLRIYSFLTRNKQLQHRLGWTPPDLLKPGTVKKLSKAKQKSGVWTTILGRIAKILVPESSILESGAVVIVKHFDISNSNDECLDMPLLICTTKNYSVQPKVPETLPRYLTKPKPYFLNCEAKHSKFAAELQETGPQKQMQAQAKGQATKLRNKQDKEDKATAAQNRAR
ncbi:hypothetical protein B0H14DRAFT_2659261 [Mycena olivaceomarginata]|nr:hypothetical protein B0H14DRAFT_2659261 [Mycena olivaceomarginata]